MHQIQQECLHALQAASNESEAFQAISIMANRLGFAYCAFGMRTPFPLSRPKVYTINNYSPAWRERYLKADYLSVDPTVRHGVHSNMPLVWSDTAFADAPALWEDARAHGLRVGWAQACYGTHGVGGMLTLARGEEALTANELLKNEAAMSWLAQASQACMARLLVPILIKTSGVNLTAREIEVMRWTADGKTSGEIASIMTISENTVNFHIKNAVLKLDAANKTAGAVKAAMLGLLS